MPFTPIHEVIDRVIKKYRIDGDIDAYKVFSVWNDIVGTKLSGHAKPVKIKEKVLYVSVDDPLWLAQIKYIKQDIIEKLCIAIKDDIFRDIKFFLKK
ncbi:MAG TPA: DUF721 domain-containing protein [Syntrophorhabdaceae bacterium]|nr:DUF721 domain-containing protein [Syntrophorhabdaceae bacterium]HPU30039.1 DUF721 domain-containing protein [Syntrophorhabdaceae bacterium]